ncbi:MAG TPA: hypothetical protein PLE74_04045 [Candidatus Cloacimonadota bacterium]|nr:hypothetical protein [Candidatus Cloacimonadota bacterium]HPT71432.1 hypothetical protein [Candidatus Cloacimonadota bacterium]
MSKLFLFCSLIILITGCAMNVDLTNPAPASLQQNEVITTPYSIAKIQYYPSRNILYIWEKGTSNIHILQNGKEVNVVGGLGFAKENFQRLTDIGVGPDGALYGLDQIPQKIKKFDIDGKWLLDYDVSWSQEPAKFAIDSSNQIILFDDIAREFIFSSDLRPEEVFRFGKFQVTHVIQLAIENNTLIVNEPEPKQTSFFTVLGEYIETRQGQMASDMKGNLYRLDTNYITFIPSNQTASSSIDPYTGIYCFDPYIITTTDHQVQRWLINYAAKR